MSWVEPGTWEETANVCYKIALSQSKKVHIINLSKTKEGSTWDDATSATYLSSFKFEHRADAVWYLKNKVNLIKDIQLNTAIQEFLNNEPVDYTHILDYLDE